MALLALAALLGAAGWHTNRTGRSADERSGSAFAYLAALLLLAIAALLSLGWAIAT